MELPELANRGNGTAPQSGQHCKLLNLSRCEVIPAGFRGLRVHVLRPFYHQKAPNIGDDKQIEIMMAASKTKCWRLECADTIHIRMWRYSLHTILTIHRAADHRYLYAPERYSSLKKPHLSRELRFCCIVNV